MAITIKILNPFSFDFSYFFLKFSSYKIDLSNDEVDIENDNADSTEFLNSSSHQQSYSQATAHNSHMNRALTLTTDINLSTGLPFKNQRQRSLTPDRNESYSSSSSLRKQRSLTPESRSITPDDRHKQGSQISLAGSRQSSSSRSNTLERKHEMTIVSTRSSSSSSYSGRDNDGHGPASVHPNNLYRRPVGRQCRQTAIDEHRIRRSR